MIFLFLWAFFAFCVAFVFGVARTIGFWASLLLSLLLSPLIGLFITLFFPTIESDKRQKQMLELQKQQVQQQKITHQQSIAEQLKTLGELRDKGDITPEEYQQAKTKLITA